MQRKEIALCSAVHYDEHRMSPGRAGEDVTGVLSGISSDFTWDEIFFKK